jgi:hypothetical protein
MLVKLEQQRSEVLAKCEQKRRKYKDQEADLTK